MSNRIKMTLFGINSLAVVVLSIILTSHAQLTGGLSFVILMIIIATSSIVSFVAFVEAFKSKPRNEKSVSGLLDSIIKLIIR